MLRIIKLNKNNKRALKLFKNLTNLVEKNQLEILNLEKIEDDSKWPKLYYLYYELKNLSDELENIKKLLVNYNLICISKL